MLSLYLSSIEDHKNDSKFESIYYSYNEMLYGIAFGVTRNHHDAEEAMQTTLFAIAKDIENVNIENIPMLKSYLYKITKNAAIDILRKRRHKTSILNIDDCLFVSSNEDIHELVEGSDKYKQIVKYITDMPAIYRDVLVLHYLHGMSTSRISEILNRNHSTVKQQLNRGTKMLREILLEVGLYD